MSLHENLLNNQTSILQIVNDRNIEIDKEMSDVLNNCNFGELILLALRYAENNNKIMDNNSFDLSSSDGVVVNHQFNFEDYFKNNFTKACYLNESGTLDDLGFAISNLIYEGKLPNDLAVRAFIPSVANDMIDYLIANPDELFQHEAHVFNETHFFTNKILQQTRSTLENLMYIESPYNFTHTQSFFTDTLNELVEEPELVLEIFEYVKKDNLNEQQLLEMDKIKPNLSKYQEVFKILRNIDFNFVNPDFIKYDCDMSLKGVNFKGTEWLDKAFDNSVYAYSNTIIKPEYKIYQETFQNHYGTTQIDTKIIRKDKEPFIKENNNSEIFESGKQDLDLILNLESQLSILVANEMIKHPKCSEDMIKMLANASVMTVFLSSKDSKEMENEFAKISYVPFLTIADMTEHVRIHRHIVESHNINSVMSESTGDFYIENKDIIENEINKQNVVKEPLVVDKYSIENKRKFKI